MAAFLLGEGVLNEVLYGHCASHARRCDSDGRDGVSSVLVIDAASLGGVCVNGCNVLCTSGSVLVAGAASLGVCV